MSDPKGDIAPHLKRIGEGLPDSNDPYESGFRDAMESFLLALEASKIPLPLSVIDTVLDAYGNNVHSETHDSLYALNPVAAQQVHPEIILHGSVLPQSRVDVAALAAAIEQSEEGTLADAVENLRVAVEYESADFPPEIIEELRAGLALGRQMIEEGGSVRFPSDPHEASAASLPLDAIWIAIDRMNTQAMVDLGVHDGLRAALRGAGARMSIAHHRPGDQTKTDFPLLDANQVEIGTIRLMRTDAAYEELARQVPTGDYIVLTQLQVMGDGTPAGLYLGTQLAAAADHVVDLILVQDASRWSSLPGEGLASVHLSSKSLEAVVTPALDDETSPQAPEPLSR